MNPRDFHFTIAFAFGAVTALGCQFKGAPSDGTDGSPKVDASAVDGQIAADSGRALDAMPGACESDGTRICFEFENSLTNSAASVLDGMQTGTVEYAAGRDGAAILLDGNGHVETGDSVLFDNYELTIGLWVNPSAYPVGANSRSGLFDIEGNIGAFVRELGVAQCSGEYGDMRGGIIPLQQWTHIACRQSAAGGTELFLNGDRLGCADDRDPTPTENEPLFIGANSPDGLSRLSGAIDTFRYNERLLTNEEICAAAGRTNCNHSPDECDD